MTPGRVFPGLKMPGQHGNTRNTVLNLRVAKVLDERTSCSSRAAFPARATAS